MLDRYIIGELIEISQNYENSSFNFTNTDIGVFSYKQIILVVENYKLNITYSFKQYSMTISDGRYINHLESLSKRQTLNLLYFFKERYDNCKEYPNAFHNALEQMCYKYKKEMELKNNENSTN